MALMKFREPNQVRWIGSRPGHNGTQVLIRQSATNATAILYTVPVGKTLYLCSVGLGYFATAAGLVQLTIRDDGLATIAFLLSDFITGAVDGQSKNISYYPPIEIPESWTLRVHSSAVGLSVHTYLFGWVE